MQRGEILEIKRTLGEENSTNEGAEHSNFLLNAGRKSVTFSLDANNQPETKMQKGKLNECRNLVQDEDNCHADLQYCTS